MKRLLFIFIIMLVFLGITCRKPVKYSDIPEIKFKSFYLRDTIDALGDNAKIGTLLFYFVDGDGDLGLRQGDTFPPYDTLRYNLFTELYEKKDSVFEKIHIVNPNYRIPYLYEQEGQNKTIKGDIKVDFTYTDPNKYKTIKYKFYIMDRALHKSNIDSTYEIKFSE